MKGGREESPCAASAFERTWHTLSQSGPDSGLGIHAQVLNTFHFFLPCSTAASSLQGYLAHQKLPPPQDPPRNH